MVLRAALLDFIADFANWDNSTVREYLDTSRALTQAAHEALGGAPGTRPLVVDPFAGGGSIPLEALRVGADAFASDLNPVPVLLNKVVLEYIPKYGQRLADEVRKWGEWIKREAEKELAEFYPKDADGATPIAYLWARTIQCEGPGCGAEVPLIRNLLWLATESAQMVSATSASNAVRSRFYLKRRRKPNADSVPCASGSCNLSLLWIHNSREVGQGAVMSLKVEALKRHVFSQYNVEREGADISSCLLQMDQNAITNAASLIKLDRTFVCQPTKSLRPTLTRNSRGFQRSVTLLASRSWRF